MYSRTALFHSISQPIEVRNLEIPVLKEGEILVKNQYATLCRSDLNTYSGKRFEKTPTILGHEVTGTIAGFGSQHKHNDARGEELTLGDLVTWAIYASDPKDRMSQAGIPQKAESMIKYGHERHVPENTLHGGFSEYIIFI